MIGLLLLVAGLAVAIAAIANRSWPQRTIRQLTTFTVLVLALAFFALTMAAVLWLMSVPCQDSACDAGAMAVPGAILFGGIAIVVTLVVGAPAAFFTVWGIRRR